MTQPFYRVEIFRAASGADCSNAGVSSRFTHALLYRPGASVAESRMPEGVALLVLDREPVRGAGRMVQRIRAIPMGEDRWVMFGGNFIWSHDSWFRQEVSEYPIPVHDRVEERYDE